MACFNYNPESMETPKIVFTAGFLFKLFAVSGTNFFVTDGVMNYGSPVSVTTNQNVITKVTAVEHVSNYTADGEPTVHYLHVFGTDVNSVKYFGVAQIQGLPPSTPVGVAAALPSIQVRGAQVRLKSDVAP